MQQQSALVTLQKQKTLHGASKPFFEGGMVRSISLWL